MKHCCCNATFSNTGVFSKICFLNFTSAKKSELPSHQDLGVFALEVEKNPAGDASEIEEGCEDVRQRGKPKTEAKTKTQCTRYARVATAAQQRCTNSLTTVPLAAIPRPQAAAQLKAASGSISLSNKSNQHQHHHEQQQQQQLSFRNFSILGPIILLLLLLLFLLLLLLLYRSVVEFTRASGHHAVTRTNTSSAFWNDAS